MPENARQIYERAASALRMPPVHEWPTFPFEGDLRPRALMAPNPEPPRAGEDGSECAGCTAPDSAYLWTDERWRLQGMGPSGLPVVVLLEPREHVDGMKDLPEDLARECGVMLGRVERAVLSVGGIERVHIGRWGEGSAHLHWWFMGRPSGLPQLRDSFAAVWDEVLPPTPDGVWEANLKQVVTALEAQTAER